MLASLPCWPACHVGLPAMLAYLPCWPACLVSLTALFFAHYYPLLFEVDFFGSH
jgi:hypothetical protein